MSDAKLYSRALLEGHAAFVAPSLEPALQAKVDAASWPDGLVDRVLSLRRDHGEIEAWIDMGWPTPEMLEQWVSMQELLVRSTLTIRLATWEDAPLVSEVCAEAPESVGDWTVTVERSPNPFAQFRLQERPHVSILEDQRVGIGMGANSFRNSYVGGERTSVHFLSGWRIREGFRGFGFSHVLQQAPGPSTSWMGLVNLWTSRLGNSSAAWLEKVEEDFADRPEEWALETERLTASVRTFDDPTQGAKSSNVRNATEADLPICIEMINRTHDGLDLFRPYTRDYLDERLCDPCWGPKPDFYPAVYGWPEFRVLEVAGQVVACAGLWDRGRDVREAWRRAEEEDGEVVVIDPTAVMDFGFAEGCDALMVELVSHLLAETRALGRSGLTIALEFQPEISALVDERYSTSTETRLLHVMPFPMPGHELETNVTRPYIDLAYW